MKRLLLLIPLLASCSSGPEPDIKSPYPYGRYLGALQLADKPDAESIRILVRMLEDPDYLVRSGAIVSLAKVGRPEFAQHIIPMRSPDVEKEPMVRSDACLALARLHNKEAVGPLLQSLKEDPNYVVRRDAAKSLASFVKEKDILMGLIGALSDKDPSVAYRAHLSLQHLTSAKDVKMSAKDWSRYIKEHP